MKLSQLLSSRNFGNLGLKVTNFEMGSVGGSVHTRQNSRGNGDVYASEGSSFLSGAGGQ